MAQFNLNDYETVEERIKRFYSLHGDGRIITKNLTTLQDRQVGTWVVEASVYLNAEEQYRHLPKSTGLAFEVDGTGMANKTSALENCETSAIGRALANMNLSGNKRTSREEMKKVEKGVTPARATRNWLIEAEVKSKDIDGLRLLYSEAKTAKASPDILEQIRKIADELTGTANSSVIDSGSAGTAE